jgi:hypothetical protein
MFFKQKKNALLFSLMAQQLGVLTEHESVPALPFEVPPLPSLLLEYVYKSSIFSYSLNGVNKINCMDTSTIPTPREKRNSRAKLAEEVDLSGLSKSRINCCNEIWELVPLVAEIIDRPDIPGVKTSYLGRYSSRVATNYQLLPLEGLKGGKEGLEGNGGTKALIGKSSGRRKSGQESQGSALSFDPNRLRVKILSSFNQELVLGSPDGALDAQVRVRI